MNVNELYGANVNELYGAISGLRKHANAIKNK